ncbi:MAG: ATP-binding cassette domain-containing protein, partial [Acetatifactor sp.]|nr:ATP-binding cassette domain-containing protein [Acetatifactor sp.]
RLHTYISISHSIGLILEIPEFISYLTGLDNLKQLASIKRIVSDETIKRYMQLFDLDPESRQTMRRYSLGMKQKIGIIQALMENPDVLVLDEPFNALDEKSVMLLRDLLRKRRDEGKLIIVTSHHKDDIEAVCNHVMTMQGGSLTDAALKAG